MKNQQKQFNNLNLENVLKLVLFFVTMTFLSNAAAQQSAQYGFVYNANNVQQSQVTTRPYYPQPQVAIPQTVHYAEAHVVAPQVTTRPYYPQPQVATPQPLVIFPALGN